MTREGPSTGAGGVPRRDRRGWRSIIAAATVVALGALPSACKTTPPEPSPSPTPTASASPTAAPTGGGVVATGTFEAALGCSADWAPDCAATTLTLDEAIGLYTGQLQLPAGDHELKITDGGASYGLGGVADGPAVTFTATGEATYVVYNPTSHLVMAAPASQVVTLPGTLQAPLGCPDLGDGNTGNWGPSCLATAMFPQADGTYTYTTEALAAGNYQVKVAIGLTWTTNYGKDGAKDGPNMSFSTASHSPVIFTYDPSTHALKIDVGEVPAFGYQQAAAIWLGRTTLAVPNVINGTNAADLTWAWAGHPELTLTPSGIVPQDLVARNALTAGYQALTVSGAASAGTPAPDLAAALIGALQAGPYEITAMNGTGEVVADTGFQVAALLDDLYPGAKDQTLGVRWDGAGVPTACVWAPTAQRATLLTSPLDVATSGSGAGSPQEHPATLDPATGVWCAAGEASWADQAYRWRVDVFVPSAGKVVTNTVTDPYSVGLTTGSGWSVFVDLASPEWAPALWTDTPVPAPLRTQAAQTIYELHIRDFSANDQTVPAEERGTYAAFTELTSDGMTHLAALAKAGLTTVHLLPSFDIASIPESRADQQVPGVPPDAGPASDAQAAAIKAVADKDAYNWGYDPWHYSTPEGSYATTADQDGGARTREFRAMVGALHAVGLRVVLDEVFNHTSASGQGDQSVLDKVVPGYYHRLDASGAIESYSCCQDTATENAMMGKLMVDAVVTWVRDYHVDGFRFDIMGAHSLQNMRDVRAALDALTVAEDGVDGSAVYLYGEAWNSGATAGDALFTAARQANLGGTGIGSFNDRLRDAVRGGGPFDSDQRTYQGFGTGLSTDPNGVPPASNYSPLQDLYYRTDLIRLGLVGNLASYELPSNQGSGTPVLGSDYGYGAAYGLYGFPGRQRAGYTLDPQESVNYAACHDGTTLFDNGIWKLPPDATMDTRVRMQVLSLAVTAFGQAPSFWQAGDDILRSKSLDANSYNSGDHFNAIDWSLATNVFGTGLPPSAAAADRGAMADLLANPANKPDTAAMEQTYQRSLDLLRVRSSTPLLTLGTGDLIKDRVHFLNDHADPTPGLVVMDIEDPPLSASSPQGAADLDPAINGAMVVFNASPDPITEVLDGQAGRAWALNAVQANGADPVVKTLTYDAATGTLTIPGRTAAVLILP